MIGCSFNFPPAADAIAFTASTGTVYEVEVDDSSFNTAYATYGERVTSP
ncbi:MAG TPA: hypothetical protein VIV59_07405 [Anaeromyxobacteraceae bacterium]